MKILWVLYSRVLEGRSHLSGSERIERVSYLSREGIDNFLVAADFQKSQYRKEKNLHLISIPIKYFPVISPVLYGLLLFIFLPFYILKIRPDFIILDPSTACSLIWKPFLSRLVHFKVLLDIRTTPVGGRMKIYFNPAIWIAKTMFDGMTIITPMMKKEICQSFDLCSDRIGVLSGGISDDFLRSVKKNRRTAKLRKRFGLSDKFVMIYHGSFRSNGGLLEAIEAVNMIKSDYPDFVLFLLGDGSAEFLSILKRTIETYGLQNNVILYGPVNFHSVPDYISMSDVGLVPLPNIPIWRYQQPLKLLEYMAMGKTIVATDSPAHRYVAGEKNNVVYVSKLNSSELAKAMKYAYKNRDKLEDWGKVGQQIVTEKYIWKKVNASLVSYLMSI